MSQGWELKTLSDLVELSPKKRIAKEMLAGEALVSFARMENLQSGCRSFMPAEDKPLASVYSSYTYFADGDVLLAKITPCFENGKLGVASGLTNGVGFGSSEFMVLRPSSSIVPEYLYYFLNQEHFRVWAAKRMTGAVGHKRVPKELIANLEIPLPPLEEQKRIVAVLDEAFEGLETARANAEANLKNAEELYNSHLDGFQNSLDESLRIKLGSIVDVKTGFAFKSKDYSDDSSDVRLLRGDNVSVGEITWETPKYWPKKQYDDWSAYHLRENDIVVAMDRTWIKSGIKCARLSASDLPSLLLQRVARLRSKDVLLQDYLFYFLTSRLFENYVLSIQTGLGVPHISGDQIKEFSFKVPSLERQQECVKEFRLFGASISKLKSQGLYSINNIIELRQSLLQRAFAGELT